MAVDDHHLFPFAVQEKENQRCSGYGGIGLAAGAAISMPWVARAAAQTLRFAHAANEIHPGHIMATSFAEALEKLVPGAFDIQIFPNRQLGDDKQNLESVVAGTLDICNASGVQFPLVTGRPALDAYQLPSRRA